MQGMCIIAHKNIEQVVQLALLLNKKFEVYIHFDKKLNINDSQLKILRRNDIKYFSEINASWGSWSIGEIAVKLFTYALRDNPKLTYLHLISGQDWPIKNISKIYEYFENNNTIYCSINSANFKKSGEKLLKWQKYYFNYDKINRRSFKGKVYHRVRLVIQDILHVNKLKKYSIKEKIYQGPNWVDLPTDVAKFCIDYLDKNKNLKKIFETGYCSDEFWVQTIIGNTPKFNKRINNNIHRYILWKKQNNSYPAILDEQNLTDIIKSDAFFMRKVDFKSKNLIKKLNKVNNNI